MKMALKKPSFSLGNRICFVERTPFIWSELHFSNFTFDTYRVRHSTVDRLNNVAAKMRIKSLAAMKSFHCGSRLFSCSNFYWCSTDVPYMLWTVLLFVSSHFFFSLLFVDVHVCVCVCSFFYIFESLD